MPFKQLVTTFGNWQTLPAFEQITVLFQLFIDLIRGKYMKRNEFKNEVCARIQRLAFVYNRMINQNTIDWLIDIMAEVATEGLIRDGVFSIRDIIKIKVEDGENKRKYYNPYWQKISEYTPKKKIHVKLGKTIVDQINEVTMYEEN